MVKFANVLCLVFIEIENDFLLHFVFRYGKKLESRQVVINPIQMKWDSSVAVLKE